MSTPAPLDRIRLLVFDWDGTLIDSIGSIVGCTQVTLRRLGLPQLPEEEIRGVIGLGLRETVETLAPGCSEELFRSILSVYRDNWVSTFSHEIRVFAGAKEMLEELRGRGYLLAVATAKGRHGLRRDLIATGLEGLFDATRTVDEARSKPHPQMLLDLLGRLGVSPVEALMIGDTTHDLEMARRAGVGAVAVASGAQNRETLEETGPLACFESVLELADWLRARTTADRRLATDGDGVTCRSAG